MEGKYKKVYFYYAGNISNTGYLALGNGPNEWMSFTSLFDKLAAVDAGGYKLFFDGSYSGLALDYLKLNNVFSKKRIDVFTSSNSSSQAYVDFYVDQQMEMTGSIGSMTYHLMQAYGNPVAESDGEEGITHKEAFNQMFIQNPVKPGGIPLFELSSPNNFSGRYLDSPGDMSFNRYFRGLDLEVRVQLRSSELDIYASQELNVRPQSSPSSNVFEISPVRQWKMEGVWDLDPSLTADLLFHYSEGIDLLSGSQGVLGLVSRTSSEQDWEAYYPVEYNESESVITARNVTEPREWAVARVLEASGLIDPIEGLSAFEVYPNPAHENVYISFLLDEATDLSARILNLNGQVMYSGDRRSYDPGMQLLTFDLMNQVAGMYFVELAGDNGLMYLPFVVK